MYIYILLFIPPQRLVQEQTFTLVHIGRSIAIPCLTYPTEIADRKSNGLQSFFGSTTSANCCCNPRIPSLRLIREQAELQSQMQLVFISSLNTPLCIQHRHWSVIDDGHMNFKTNSNQSQFLTNWLPATWPRVPPRFIVMSLDHRLWYWAWAFAPKKSTWTVSDWDRERDLMRRQHRVVSSGVDWLLLGQQQQPIYRENPPAVFATPASKLQWCCAKRNNNNNLWKHYKTRTCMHPCNIYELGRHNTSILL